jgi:hypothetical protein
MNEAPPAEERRRWFSGGPVHLKPFSKRELLPDVLAGQIGFAKHDALVIIEALLVHGDELSLAANKPGRHPDVVPGPFMVTEATAESVCHDASPVLERKKRRPRERRRDTFMLL